MSSKTNIQWCDATWNVARGCKKVDEDCKNCYMYRDSMNDTRYRPLDVVRTKTVFNFPLKYKEIKSQCWDGKPLVFTSSLTDFFIEEIDSYRQECWDIIRKCPHLVFLILTKRPDRIKANLPADWGEGWDNVWFGTSVGSEKSVQRIWDLIEMKGKCKGIFLSLEPLWGPVDLNEYYFKRYRALRHVPVESRTKLIHLIDWVIVGGESGNEIGKYRYRPCDLEWITDIIKKCKAEKKPVFVKQVGTFLAKQLGYKDRHGGDIAEFPASLQVRQFPGF